MGGAIAFRMDIAQQASLDQVIEFSAHHCDVVVAEESRTGGKTVTVVGGDLGGREVVHECQDGRPRRGCVQSVPTVNRTRASTD